MREGRTVWLATLLSACIVAVSFETTIEEPVDLIDVTLAVGNIEMKAQPGDVVIAADFGGVGDGDLSYDVVDRVLTIEYACGGSDLCGGDLSLWAPARVGLTARLSLGDVSLDGTGGDRVITVNTGSVDGDDLVGGQLIVSMTTGDVDVSFASAPDRIVVDVSQGSVSIDLPAGDYELDLSGSSVDIDGIRSVPGGRPVVVSVDQGSVELRRN